VRFDVLKRDPFRLGNRCKRADLRVELILRLSRIHLHFAPAETLKVSEAGMRADGDAVLFGQADGAPHHRRIARMRAARDVGRRNVRQHVGIGSH
jgi:hypothetical protein